MRRGIRGGLVITLDAGEGDVVADYVFVRVDADVVDAHGAGEAAGVLVVAVDDLAGRRGDVVGGCKVKDLGFGDGGGRGGFRVSAAPDAVAGGGEGGGGCYEGEGCEELHFGWLVWGLLG